MENEEKEDLLLEVTESEEDACEKEDRREVEEKILDFIRRDARNGNSTRKALALVASCLFMFLSSSVLIITFPVYIQYSKRSGIQTYSKLVTLSAVNAALFGAAHLIGLLSKWAARKSPSGARLRLPNVFKISFLLAAGNVIIFWLIDGNYVSCHLQDPLKGCAVVFSLLFYFVLSRKRMSAERIFCAVTVVVGVFVTIDFGICDRFRCNGNTIAAADGAHRLHFLYVILYIIAHGIWVLHLTYTEMSWSGFKSSNSNLSLSVLSNVSKTTSVCEYAKHGCQSLSVICHEGESAGGRGFRSLPAPGAKKSLFKPSIKLFDKNGILNSRRANSDNSLNNSVPCTDRLCAPAARKGFPITSTPVHEPEAGHPWSDASPWHLTLWQHIISCVLVLSLCWLPTVSFLENGKSKLLVEVVREVCQSFSCHSGLNDDPECGYLFAATLATTVSYLVFTISSLEVLRCSESAVSVVCVMMLALPMSSLWWSLYRLDGTFSRDALEFSPEITGEAVCAMLGFPIVGIGCLLMVKSHIREFKMSA